MKKNNKGFTLVELIIVIAIIAILAVVVAPQYLKYVENSRIATDENTLDEIAHAAEIAAIGDGHTTVGDGDFSITISNDGSFDTTAGTPADLHAIVFGGALSTAEEGEDDIVGVFSEESYEFKSEKYTEAESTIIYFRVLNGVGEWSDTEFPADEN